MIWSFEKKVLNLKVNWKLSRNQTTVKENILVNYKTDFGVSSSEIAPNIRYGETLENIFSNTKMLIAVHCEDEATIQANTLKYKEEFLVISTKTQPSPSIT